MAFSGILPQNLMTPAARIRGPFPNEQQVPHLALTVRTNDVKRAAAGLPADSFERPIVVLPPDINGTTEWAVRQLQYLTTNEGFDGYALSIPLVSQQARTAATQVGVAFGLRLADQTFWCNTPATNTTADEAAGPWSMIRGQVGARGAQMPSGGTAAMLLSRVQDPFTTTMYFEYQDNNSIFGNASEVMAKLALASERRYQNNTSNSSRVDRPDVLLKRVGPNRYAGNIDFHHSHAETANPATSFSRELVRVGFRVTGATAHDGEGDGVEIRM